MPTMDQPREKPDGESPPNAYSRLLGENRVRLAFHQRWDRYLGYAKVATGLLVAFLIVWLVERLHGIWMLIVAMTFFTALAIAHERVLMRIRQLKSLITHYERGLARLDDCWAGTGEGGERFIDNAHPYARDLDLFGKGSIFELLCTFRTRAGEETLAHWLLKPAPPGDVRARQNAAQELMPRLEFRERLFTAGDRVRLGLHPDALTEWGEKEISFGTRGIKLIAAALSVVWVASLSYGLLFAFYSPLLLLSSINIIVNWRFMKRLATSVEAIEAATGDLDLLVEVLEILERARFSSPKLRHLQAALTVDGMLPSAAVKKLDRITGYLESRRNPLVRVFDSFVFYTVQLTFWAESWRREFGPAIRGWLAAVGELEALASLSGYAFEHPNDSWPEFVDARSLFEAESFAHPLLPEDKAIRNDLKLGDGMQLIVLSGPNMSGKSTFIRGIGINAVLAQCGAPVRAKRLRMSQLAIGASICILDSLQGGVSRFYAEIKRLKLISDSAQGPIPVIFLLDELLSGTNSHDRLLGTQMVVGTLVQRGAIGMVTTHDLALTQIPENMNGKARNYHFEDHLENGQLAFDFKIKAGVVQTSNALRLMQTIGLVSEHSL
jgi:hypothetical protein